MIPRQCDARLCTDSAGRAGFIDAIVSGPDGAETVSAPVGACSSSLVTVWHGLSTPAIACGRHAGTYMVDVAVFRGHRNRVSA